MKKIAFLSLIGAFVVLMASCDKTGARAYNDDEDEATEQENEEGEEEEVVEAEYFDTAYDIDDVIDPNDEEAYALYGSQYEEAQIDPGYEEYEPKAQGDDVDATLDRFEQLLTKMRNNPNDVLNWYSDLLEIVSELEPASMTDAQLSRFNQLADEMSAIMGD